MALAPQPQRELWSMDPTPVMQPSAVRPDPSRYPTAAWPAVPSADPASQPPAYKMPSPLISSSPAPDARPAGKPVDEDLRELLGGFTTPAPASAPVAGYSTNMVAPSFPTMSPAPAPQATPLPTPLQHVMPPQSPQPRVQMQPASPAPQAQGNVNAEVMYQLAAFMRRAEENFSVVSRQLSEVERRLMAVEQATKDTAEQTRTSAIEKKRMLETIQQQLTELRRQAAMATVAAPPPQPVYAQPQPVPQAAPHQAPPPMYMPTQAPQPQYGTRLPPLQPATSMYMPPSSTALAPRGSRNDQEEADRLLALRLQEELNRDSPSDLLPGVDTARAHSKPTPGGPPSASHSNEAHSECPICGMEQPISQIEAHVHKHLEDNPNVAPEQKEGFLSWLFASKRGQAASRPEPPKLTPPPQSKPSMPMPKAQPQVLNLGQQQGVYPSAYPRYGTQSMHPGMQIPPGMQLATIPPGAPIPPGAVPLGNYPGMYPPPSQMYYSQAP